MVLADMLVEEIIGSSLSRKGRQGDSIGSSDLRLLKGPLDASHAYVKKGRLGILDAASQRSAVSIRCPLANMCRGGKESLTLRIVEEMERAFISVVPPNCSNVHIEVRESQRQH